MSAIVFLLIVVVVVRRRRGSCSGCSTAQPNTLESGIDAFRREMDALAPPPTTPSPSCGAKRPPGRARRRRGR